MELTIEQVVEEFDFYVETLLLKQGVPPQELEDFKQEVWLRVHRAEMLANHDGRAKFSTRLWWVVRSVADARAERLRYKGRDRESPWDAGLERTASDGWQSAVAAAGLANRYMVERRLDGRARRVLGLVCEGLAVAQIAAVLAVSETTVRSIYRQITEVA